MELASGIKKEYLEFELNDHKIIQGMYVSAWNMIKASFTKFGPELGYSFDLEMTCGYAEWLRSFYAANRASILNDYRGINDRETGEILLVGDWDVERRARRFQRLNRVIRFLLHGLKPHQADLDSISYKEIPAGILSRSEWFGQKNKDTNMYLQCMVTYIGAIDINAKGKTGNSGELTRLFPAVPFVNAIQLYWEHCAAGKEVNPYLSVAKDRAVEFDAHWMDRAMKWLEKNPYGDEFVYPENDYEGFEEAEISESDDDDSVA
jgi:hypothetical protein